MKKLINMLFAGKSINTSKGELTFDKDGACMLEDEVADAFKNVKGFVVENDAENNDKADDEKDSDKNVDAPENNSNTADTDKEDSVNSSENETDAENEDDVDEDSIEDNKSIDFNSLTVPSLKKYAKDNGIDIAGLEKKEHIIKAIKNQS